MIASPRFSLRLRQRALRCYEVGLYAALVAMAVAVALPSVASGGDEDAAHCGKNQSNTDVITR
jgi:hypothetical protein